MKPQSLPVESPCVLDCCLDEQDICLGCGRSEGEIMGWWEADDDERRAIRERAAIRMRQRKTVDQ